MERMGRARGRESALKAASFLKVPQFMPWVGQEEYAALSSCFEINWITEGPKSEEFRKKLLEITGAKYGVLAPNGTLALYLALRSAGIGPGDEVIVPDFTFMGSASSVEMAGARPIFVDVNRRNFQIDLSQADHLVTEKTRGIMPVHIYGTAADMDHVDGIFPPPWSSGDRGRSPGPGRALERETRGDFRKNWSFLVFRR